MTTKHDNRERLYLVANDDESAILDELSVKAGVMWRCKCEAACVNDADEECPNCGAFATANAALEH